MSESLTDDEIMCRHEVCDDQGHCKECGAKARIFIEGLQEDRKIVDMRTVSDGAKTGQEVEIDALKAELAESANISAGRLVTMNALYAEIERLTRERDVLEEVNRQLNIDAIAGRNGIEWYSKVALPASVAAALEKVIGILEFSPTYHKHVTLATLCHCEVCAYVRGNVTEIRALLITPGQASALEQVKAQARLEEIKAFDCDSIFTSENKRKRIAALEAVAGRKS